MVSVIAKKANDMLIAPFEERTSIHSQRRLALHLERTRACAASLTYNRTIGHLSRQKCLWKHHYYVLKLSSNGASTIFGLASETIQRLCGDINPRSNNWPFFYAKPLATTLAPCPKVSINGKSTEHQWSINYFQL